MKQFRLMGVAFAAVVMALLLCMTIGWSVSAQEVGDDDPVVAPEGCYYAGLYYSNGACLNGQRCSNGSWVDDANCNKKTVATE